MPRRKLTPTEEQRLHVKSFAAMGTKPHEIARYFGVSEGTLEKYYKEELFRGPMEANVKVAKTLYDMACDGQTPAASIYWLKVRGGWSESRDNRPTAIPDFIVALEKKAA